MDEPTAIEDTVPVRTSTYIIEADRLKGELPAKDADRLRFYKARSPLGDAEFYLAVVELAPAHRDRLDALRAEMARVFSVKGKIPKQLAVEVQAIMRQDRALRPPRYNGEVSRAVVGWWREVNGAVEPIRHLPNAGYYGKNGCPCPNCRAKVPADDTVADPRD